MACQIGITILYICNTKNLFLLRKFSANENSPNKTAPKLKNPSKCWDWIKQNDEFHFHTESVRWIL